MSSYSANLIKLQLIQCVERFDIRLRKWSSTPDWERYLFAWKHTGSSKRDSQNQLEESAALSFRFVPSYAASCFSRWSKSVWLSLPPPFCSLSSFFLFPSDFLSALVIHPLISTPPSTPHTQTNKHTCYGSRSGFWNIIIIFSRNGTAWNKSEFTFRCCNLGSVLADGNKNSPDEFGRLCVTVQISIRRKIWRRA